MKLLQEFLYFVKIGGPSPLTVYFSVNQKSQMIFTFFYFFVVVLTEYE